MSPKRIAIKVYLSEDNEFYKRILELSEKTTLSLSSIAGASLRHGLPLVENQMREVFNGLYVEKPAKKRKAPVKK